jgi:hypothetical protein
MTPAQALDSYRRMLAKAGEDITVRRYGGTGGARAIVMQAVARGRPIGAGATQLVGETVQRDCKVILINDPAAPIANGNVPLAAMLPLTESDKLFFRGAEVAIQAIDDSTRRIQGTLVALEIQVRG